MGNMYKLYEHLCYKAMDWAYEKGKVVDKKRKFESYDNYYLEDYKFNAYMNNLKKRGANHETIK